MQLITGSEGNTNGVKFPNGKQIMTWITYPTNVGKTINWKTSNVFEFKQNVDQMC